MPPSRPLRAALFAAPFFACTTAPLPEETPPTIVLASPLDGSMWPIYSPVVVRGMILDDLDEPTALRVEIGVDDELVRTPSLAPNGRLDAELTLLTGAHELEVRATDSAGNRTTTLVSFLVDDTPALTAPVLSVDPAAPVTGDPIRATLVAPSTEPDGTTPQSLAYIWSWTVDGALTDLTTPIVPKEQVFDGAEWAVSTYAFDGTNVSPTATTSVRVGNAPPSVTGLVLTPTTANTTTVLTCGYEAVADLESDAVTVVWSWTVDDATIDNTTDTLAPGLALRGQEVRCGLVVTDARGASTSLESDPVVLDNAPPTLTTVSISPESPTSADDLVCYPSDPADPDGDPLSATFWWTIGTYITGTGPVLTHGQFARGDSVVCNVELRDAAGGSVTTSSPGTAIANAPPAAAEVGFATPIVVPGHSATCEITRLANDADGDILHYSWTWTIDGTPDAETTSTLDTHSLAVGTLLTCTVVANDGSADGPPVSASLEMVSPTSGELTASAPLLPTPADALSYGESLAVWPHFDGPEALLVTSPSADVSRGAVFLYAADTLAAGGTDPSLTLYGAAAGDQLGAGLADVGDLDGDGEDDLGIGEHGPSGGAGGAWILYGPLAVGNASVNDIANASIRAQDGAATGYPDGDAIGAGIGGADLDGDGLSDLALGAPGQGYAGVGAGAVGVWFGGDRLAGQLVFDEADLLVLGAPGDGLGAVLVGPGDMDDDGLEDLAIGAPTGGFVVVVGGGAYGGPVYAADHTILLVRGETGDDEVGTVTSAPGDLDEDGVPDLIIGAPGVNESAGAIGLVWGVAALDTERVLGGAASSSVDERFAGEAPGERLGAATASGDFDGDGLIDLVFGAPGKDPSSDGSLGGAGVVELYAGRDRGTWWEAGATARWNGWETDGGLGRVVVADIDLDQDLYDELIGGSTSGLTVQYGP